MPLGAGEQKLRAAVKSPSCKCWMVCLVYPKPYTPRVLLEPHSPTPPMGSPSSPITSMFVQVGRSCTMLLVVSLTSK